MQRPDNICVLVVGHKGFSSISNQFDRNVYKTISVGPNSANEASDYKDNQGDNIASKNDTYNELTAQYWAWRNLEPTWNIVGVVHYRRFFLDTIHRGSYLKHLISEKQIRTALKKRAVILPCYYAKESFQKQKAFKEQSLHDLFYEVLFGLYPETRQNVIRLTKSDYRCGGNMFICRKRQFDDYSRWLFKLLTAYEKLYLERLGKPIPPRHIGYISESLPNLFFGTYFGDKKIKRYPIQNLERNHYSRIRHIADACGLMSIRRLCRHLFWIPRLTRCKASFSNSATESRNS